MTLPSQLRALSLMCALASGVLSLALDPQVAYADALEDALEVIEATMAEWTEHQIQAIQVTEISGLLVDGADSSVAQLQARLKSLLTKKRSNREWKGYWEGEAELSGRLLAAYETVAPVGGEGLIDARLGALRSAQEAAARTRRVETARVQALIDAGDAARAALAEVLAETRAQQPEHEAAVTSAKAAFIRAAEPIARLEAAVAAATSDPTGLATAQQALVAARDTRDAAADGLLTAREVQTNAERLISDLEQRLAGGGDAAPIPPADAVTTGRIENLVRLDKQLAQAKTSLALAESADEVATSALAAAELLSEAFRARRPALVAWGALAKDKMSNQDVFLDALNGDIAAVEERLREMDDTPLGAAIGRSAKQCNTERGPDQAPLEHHRACESATKEELRDLAAIVEDTKAAALLNERGAKSIATLESAQDRDLALVIREVDISLTEDRRATTDAETARWREIWAAYAERARAKKTQLAAALQTTKDTARTITVNRAFYASELEALAQRQASLETKLADRTGFGRYVGALFASVWSFIVDAYMVPIYLLLAWLLLRLLKRGQRRLTESAKRKVHGRDEEQRIDTLAVVGQGAIKLVVYIATGLLCLGAMGVDTGPILGGAAIFGLAISFGSQSLVKDFVTGFFILLENQYAVGDFVDIGSSSGTVEAITMRRTVLRDLAGRVHTIPNGAISNVINQTQGWSRVLMHIGVAYGTDLSKVETVINRVGDALFAEPDWAARLEEPPRYIGLTSFGDSDLTVRVMFKTAIFEQWAAEREFNRRIKDAFEAEGIQIPFPQRDLHIITAAPAAPA